MHAYKSYYPKDYGGVPQAIRHLVHGCAEHSVESEVFTLSPEAADDPIIFEGRRVTQAQTSIEASSTPLFIKAFSKFRKIAPQFHVIYYHHPYPFGDLLSLHGGRFIPSIVTYHSDIVRQRLLKYA